MSKRNDSEFRGNATNRRGVVVDRDPKKMKIKVRFEDEDDVVSAWIDVPVKSSTGVRLFQMPGKDDEVWCALDAKGEAGCLIGSRYNAKDSPPIGENDDIVLSFPGGSIHVDTASGAVVLDLSGPVKVKGSAIDLESATLTHNGVDIGYRHRHKEVLSGPSLSGEPV